MRLRLVLMLLLSPVMCMVALARPYLGLLGIVIMYYFRPEVWLPPSWFRPQMWLTVAVGIGWLTHARTIRFPPLMAIAVLIVLLCFMNAMVAVESSKPAFEATQVILKLVVVMMFTVNLVDTPQRMHWFLWANVAGMVYNLKAIILQGLSSGGVSDNRVDVGVGQGGGANYIAMILTMTLPFLYMRILNGKRWERWSAMVFAGIYVIGVVVTGSRGGFLSLGAVVLYMLFRSNRKVLGAVVLGCMIALFMIVVPTHSIERFKQGVGVEGERDESAEGRLKLWAAALKMFSEHPITGVGLDNYQLLSPRYVGVYAGKTGIKYEPGVRGKGFVTHSTWFQTLAEGGLLLSIPFFLMFPIAYMALRRVKRLPLSEPTRRMLSEQALVLEGTFVAFIVSSTFGSHFKIDFLWWYFGAVAALRMIAESEYRALFPRTRPWQRTAPRRESPVGAAP